MSDRAQSLRMANIRFGDRLRRRRRARGFAKQQEFATALGTDQSRVSRWESGYEFPGEDYRAAIKRLLKVNSRFFDDDDAAPRSLSFTSAAEFLLRYSTISEARKALVMSVVFGDKQMAAGHPELAPLLDSIAAI